MKSTFGILSKSASKLLEISLLIYLFTLPRRTPQLTTTSNVHDRNDNQWKLHEVSEVTCI